MGEEALYVELPDELYEQITEAVEEENEYAHKKQFVELAARAELGATSGVADGGTDVDIAPVLKKMESLADKVESIDARIDELDQKVERVSAANDSTDQRTQRIASIAQDYIPLVDSTDEFLDMEVPLRIDVDERATITGTPEDVAGALEYQEDLDVELQEVSMALAYLADSVSRIHTHSDSELGRRYYDVRA